MRMDSCKTVPVPEAQEACRTVAVDIGVVAALLNGVVVVAAADNKCANCNSNNRFHILLEVLATGYSDCYYYYCYYSIASYLPAIAVAAASTAVPQSYFALWSACSSAPAPASSSSASHPLALASAWPPVSSTVSPPSPPRHPSTRRSPAAAQCHDPSWRRCP